LLPILILTLFNIILLTLLFILIYLLKPLYILRLAIKSQNIFLSLKKLYIAFKNLIFYNKNILQNHFYFKALNKFLINFVISLKTILSIFLY